MPVDQRSTIVPSLTWRYRCGVNNENRFVDGETCLSRTTIPNINNRWCTKSQCGASLRHCQECLQRGNARIMSALVVAGSKFCELHGGKVLAPVEEQGQRVVDLAVMASEPRPYSRKGGSGKARPPQTQTGTATAIEANKGGAPPVGVKNSTIRLKVKKLVQAQEPVEPAALPAPGAAEAPVEVVATLEAVGNTPEVQDVAEIVGVAQQCVSKYSPYDLECAYTVFSLRTPPVSMRDDRIQSMLQISARRLRFLIRVSEGEEFRLYLEQKVGAQMSVPPPTQKQLRAWRRFRFNITASGQMVHELPEFLSGLGGGFLQGREAEVASLREQLADIAAEVERVRKLLG